MKREGWHAATDVPGLMKHEERRAHRLAIRRRRHEVSNPSVLVGLLCGYLVPDLPLAGSAKQAAVTMKLSLHRGGRDRGRRKEAELVIGEGPEQRWGEDRTEE